MRFSASEPTANRAGLPQRQRRLQNRLKLGAAVKPAADTAKDALKQSVFDMFEACFIDSETAETASAAAFAPMSFAFDGPDFPGREWSLDSSITIAL